MSTPNPAGLQRQFRRHAAHRTPHAYRPDPARSPWFRALLVVGSLAWMVVLAAIALRLFPDLRGAVL